MALDTYALVTLQNLKDWLGITVTTYDTILENLINATGYKIERYIGRNVKARDYILFADPEGSNTILLPQYPVVSCSYVGYGSQVAMLVSASSSTADLTATVEIKENVLRYYRNTSTTQATSAELDFTLGSGPYPTVAQMAVALDAITGFDASTVVNYPMRYLHKTGPIDVVQSPANLTCPSQTASGYRIELATGLLHMPRSWRSDWGDEEDEDGFGCGKQTVVIEYNAGYSTVPYDLQQATLEIAGAAYRARFKDANVDSETLGDYSYTSAVRDASNDLLDGLLASWREIR